MLSNRGRGDFNREPEDHLSSAASPSPDAILANLDKVLSGETFVNSPQLCRFLRFIVEQEIAGQADQLKEYVLGLQVLGKDESFDPRIDTAVRTEARRLRQKLAEYYQGRGQERSDRDRGAEGELSGGLYHSPRSRCRLPSWPRPRAARDPEADGSRRA